MTSKKLGGLLTKITLFRSYYFSKTTDRVTLGDKDLKTTDRVTLGDKDLKKTFTHESKY